MGWLGRSLGDFGSQLGQGQEIAQNWREREQKMKFEAARAKLAELMGPLQLEQLQEQIKQLQQPKPEGTIQTPGGGTAGLTFGDGKFNVQPLAPGMDKNSAKQQILKMIPTAPKEYQGALQAHADSIDAGEDPLTALQKAQALLGQAAGRVVTAENKTRFKFEPAKGVITDKEGKEWSIYDPQLPPELKTLVAAEAKRKGEEDKKKADDEARRSNLQFDNLKKIFDLREGAKPDDLMERDAVASGKEARQARALLDDVNKNIESAKKGNAKASLALVFAAVRTMVQGAGRMTNVEIEQELKAGSYAQRLERWYDQAAKGTMPEDQMDMIREVVESGFESKRGTAAQDWDYSMKGKPMPPWLKPIEKQQNVPAPPPGYVIQQPGATH